GRKRPRRCTADAAADAITRSSWLMALKTITGKVVNPANAPVSALVVSVNLSQSAVIAGTQEVINSPVLPTIASDGTYSLQLQANNDLTPTGTYYTVTESVSSAAIPAYTAYQFTVVVPQTAGPFVMSSIMA